ncbi:hypothetical protein CA606_01615 [Caulobacter vibrioides]|uniref:Uncharacterized protein n=1 Tax=Caulobacter vibrioides TaxID=155892 RepID=A0A290MGI6_CAUVI|nr:hypothetical protein CA606_01615 [Caulobacter vibrioides]
MILSLRERRRFRLSPPWRTVPKSSPPRGRRPKAGGGSAAEPASSPSVGFADTSPARGRIGPP